MSDRRESRRLFLALYPPQEIAAAMLEEAARLRIPGRATPLEQVHLTVLFMGDRPAAEMPGIERSMREAAAGVEPVVLTPTEVCTFPARRSRMVVMACDATPNLHTLYARLVRALTRPGDRGVRDTLLPHFTLRRFERDARVRATRAHTGVGPIECRELVLVRSELGKGDRGGAMHTPVVSVPLADGA